MTEERRTLRNHARVIFPGRMMDYLLGEVTYDGHRIHGLLAGLSVFLNVILIGMMMMKKKKGEGGGEATGVAGRRKRD